MKKSILWLGIRSYEDEQEAIFNACNELNLDVVLFAPSCPALLKDRVDFYQVNLSDNDQVLKVLEEVKSSRDFVLSLTWTDPYVELNALVSENLGTPGPTLSSATKARNKYEMIKAVWEVYPQYAPSFKLVSEVSDLEDITFPCVIKPISASGSKGVYYSENKKQAQNAIGELINLGKEGNDKWSYNRYGLHFLCESYISGQEFSVEGVVIDQECCIAGITEKKVIEPWFIEYQHIFPARFGEDVVQEIKKATSTIINALGLNNAPFHLEAKWTKDGFKLIEIAARIGGGLITTHLVSNALEVNWIKCVVAGLINQKPVETKDAKACVGINYSIAPVAGKLHCHSYSKKIHASKELMHYKNLVKNESLVSLPPEDFSSLRLGYVLAKAERYIDVDNFFKEIAAETTVIIQNQE